MEDIFYSADHHFLHGGNDPSNPRRGVIEWCKRPFDNVDDMTEALIEAHNSVVERSTNVIFLGDFAVGRDSRAIQKIFDKLKGRKHLIIGNHDRNDVQRLRWSSDPSHRKTIQDGPFKIYLDHMPIHSWPGMYHRPNPVYHFHGHTHGRLPSRGRMIDVGVDSWDFAPIRAVDAIARMREWNADFDDYAPERSDIIRSAEENHPDYDYDLEMRDDEYEESLITLTT